MDESGINTFVTREYGRAFRGQKVEGQKSGRKFQRVNIIGALCDGKHIALQCYKNTTNAAFFLKWFSENLIKEVPRGGVIIMDNASFHSKRELAKIIKKTRRKISLLFLPPYSPDLNPIEKSWGNMKRKLRDTLPHHKTLEPAIYDYFHLTDT